VRLKQWEQRAQWEPKRQTGRRQEKMPSEVSRTSPSSEAGELWEQRAQWEPKRQTGRRQEKMPSEVSRTSPSSEAGELDPRYARSPAPKPEPEPEEEQVPEGAGRFVTRSGRQWGLISNATTTMRRNLTIISVDAKQWQAAAHDEMTSLIKASVSPSPSLSCPRSSCFQQMGLQGQKAIRWVD